MTKIANPRRIPIRFLLKIPPLTRQELTQPPLTRQDFQVPREKIRQKFFRELNFECTTKSTPYSSESHL